MSERRHSELQKARKYLDVPGRRRSPLLDAVGVISRRRWLVAGVFAVTLLLVVVWTVTAPKQYEARMKILVKNFRANMVVSTGTNAQTAPPTEVSEAEINTEIELLNSNDLLRQVAVASDLAKAETVTKAGGDQGQLKLEMAVARSHRNLKISPVRKANIIEINYTASDPQQVIKVLRQLSATYLEAHVRIHGTPGTYDFFSKQADQYLTVLKNAGRALTEFRAKNDIVLFVQQKDEVLRRASESGSMLLATEAAIREYTRALADARGQASKAEARVVTQNRTSSYQSVERLSTMIVELENRRTQLLAKYRPDDRLVQEVTDELTNTEAALDKAKKLTGSEQATDINPVKQSLELDIAKQQAQLSGLEARRQALAEQARSYRGRLNKLDNSTAEYESMIRNEKEAEENYLLYARKTEEARIADALDQQKIANVSIAEHPVEPRLPANSNGPLNLAVGTIMAGFLSIGAAFSAEYLQPRSPAQSEYATEDGPEVEERIVGAGTAALLAPADLEVLTGLPVLAVSHHRYPQATRSSSEGPG